MTTAESPASQPVIELQHARFGYGERAVVLDVDLTVHAGERIALLGPNGCGKSTLVRGLLGLVGHLGGEVRLLGTPLGSFHERHRLGYVPQHNALTGAGSATVREIVQTGRLPLHGLFSLPGRRTRADQGAVDEAIELVELTGQADTPVSTLSGGQQRRALIARALSAGPEVLVMDEPTAGVDQGHQAGLAVVLERLATRGTTLVLVTHETDPMREVLQRAVVMDAGRILTDTPFSAYEAEMSPLQRGHAHHHLGDGAHRRRILPLDPLEIHTGEHHTVHHQGVHRG